MTNGFELTRLATAPRTELTITAYRNIAPRYDPRSGEGARIHRGRFNPPGSFPTLYLCETRNCVVAELTRQGMRNVVGVEGILPRWVYRYELQLEHVLDLTDQQVRDHLGLTSEHLTSDDWTVCQQLGTAAHDSGDQGIRTPSATGVDVVIAVFTELAAPGLRDVSLTETWQELGDLEP